MPEISLMFTNSVISAEGLSSLFRGLLRQRLFGKTSVIVVKPENTLLYLAILGRIAEQLRVSQNLGAAEASTGLKIGHGMGSVQNYTITPRDRNNKIHIRTALLHTWQPEGEQRVLSAC